MPKRITAPIARALSVRQPYLEQILTGRKTIEYRTRATHVRERVYLYASRIPGPAEAFADAGLEWQELRTGLILGSVEIIGCERGGEYYEWQLARPQRLAKPIPPQRRPQPVFFFPFAVPSSKSSSGGNQCRSRNSLPLRSACCRSWNPAA